MAAIYCNVKFKNCGTRKAGEGELSRAGPSHSDLHRPDDPADPSPEPESKVVTIGQAKERILWISLCTVLFAVALIIGVLFISGNVSHEEPSYQLTAPCVGKSCCAEGWKYFRGKCYYFSDDVRTWTASRDDCVAVGGDLLIISTTEEQTFIKRSKPGEGEQRYWVGLTDAVTEGDWRWLDGTRLRQTPKCWSGNEPDNWKGKHYQYPEGEDCALMVLNTNSYVLLDAFCD
ncbi:C-type lectin domain family 4 member E-like, partial [Colossoma macropomum]|uniref:C-type lectin domain family 4 member E-like n=1 Tax=Colossoma macropomum TaxID=42526 RepID=UPI001865483D